MARQLLGQAFHSGLVGDSAFTGSDHHEEMVFGNGASQLWKFVPMRHQLVFGSHALMAVLHIFAQEFDGVVASEEDDAALQILCQSRQALQPSVETGLELGSRRHSHLNAPYGVQRLLQSCHDNLSVQTVEQALVELAPELWRHLFVLVHADDDFAGAELLEGMFDAVGNVGGDAHLCLHPHIASRCILRHFLQQLLPVFLIAPHVGIVINHIQRHQPSVQLRIARQYGQVDETVGILGIFHGDEHLLVIAFGIIVLTWHVFVANGDLLGSRFGHKCRYDAREENHDDDTIQNVVVHKVSTVAGADVHSHHDHGDGASSVGGSQSEHHVTR